MELLEALNVHWPGTHLTAKWCANLTDTTSNKPISCTTKGILRQRFLFCIAFRAHLQMLWFRKHLHRICFPVFIGQWTKTWVYQSQQPTLRKASHDLLVQYQMFQETLGDYSLKSKMIVVTIHDISVEQPTVDHSTVESPGINWPPPLFWSYCTWSYCTWRSYRSTPPICWL